MNKISGLTTVCLDIDWTLVKHSENQEDDVLRMLGLEPDPEFKKQVRYFWDNLSKKLQNGKPVEREQIYDLAEKMIPYLKKIDLTGEQWYSASEIVDEIELIDGAEELLKYLQTQGYYIVASTNTFADDQARVLKKLKVFDYFDRIFGWDTICAKPHRKALFSLLSLHSSDSMIFIGDSVYTDINFANKVGIKSIGVNLKYKDREHYIKPTIHVSSLLEIKNYL